MSFWTVPNKHNRCVPSLFVCSPRGGSRVSRRTSGGGVEILHIFQFSEHLEKLKHFGPWRPPPLGLSLIDSFSPKEDFCFYNKRVGVCDELHTKVIAAQISAN